jgi:hypothetical protein
LVFGLFLVLFIEATKPMFEPTNSSNPASAGAGSGNPGDRSGDCRPVAGDQFPERSPEVRHVLFGPEAAVRLTISNLHRRGYAEANDWCKPQPTGQPGEVMTVLIKRVPLN